MNYLALTLPEKTHTSHQYLLLGSNDPELAEQLLRLGVSGQAAKLKAGPWNSLIVESSIGVSFALGAELASTLVVSS